MTRDGTVDMNVLMRLSVHYVILTITQRKGKERKDEENLDEEYDDYDSDSNIINIYCDDQISL